MSEEEILRKHLQAHMEANKVASKTIGDLRAEVSRLTAELAAARVALDIIANGPNDALTRTTWRGVARAALGGER